MRENRFAIRTVRNGTVKIHHKVYKLSERFRQYDKELERMRFAFGLYPGEPYVCLWGSEKSYKDVNVDPLAGLCLVDGYFPWEWWEEVMSNVN